MSVLVDIHSHLLPTIDDSHLKEDEMFAFYERYHKLGFSLLCFTPHLYNPYVTTQIGEIGAVFSKAQKMASEIGLKAALGAEVFIREYPTYKVLPILNKYVLCETDVSLPPHQLEEKLDKIAALGFKVILAHIERYRWLNMKSSFFNHAQEKGYLFQVNAEKDLTSKAKDYLDSGIVDFLGSDNHGDIDRIETLFDVYNQYPYVADKMEKFLL